MDIELAFYHRYAGVCMYKKTVSYKFILPTAGIQDYLKNFAKIFSYFNPTRLADYGIIPIKATPEIHQTTRDCSDATISAAPGTDVTDSPHQISSHGNEREEKSTNVLTYESKNTFDSLARPAMDSEKDAAVRKEAVEDMSELINRLATFQTWPDDNLTSTVPLASFGFYYTGNSDMVKCFQCGVEITGWSKQDKPETKHREKNPHCILVKTGEHRSDQTSFKREANEKPVLLNMEEVLQQNSIDKTRKQKFTSQHYNGASNYYIPPEETKRTQSPRVQNGMPDRPNAGSLTGFTTRDQMPRLTSPNGTPQSQTNVQDQPVTKPILLRTTSETLNAIATSTSSATTLSTSGENWFSLRDTSNHQMMSSQPADYTIETNRLASFLGHWAADTCVQPPELATAGLYYTGPGDRVQCAWCRGGLHGWEQGDTAIGEHRRHFPQCSFIRNKISEMVSPVRPTPREQHSTTQSLQRDSGNKEEKLVEIVSHMGYTASFIEKALDRLKQKGESMTVSNLLDVVFQLENEVEDTAEVYTTSENERHSAIDTPEHTEDLSGHAVGGTTSSTSGQLQGSSEQQNTGGGAKALDSIEHLSELVEENTRLKGMTLCKVCLDEEVGLLFLPCRHLVCCEECGAAVKHCPVCRTLIVGTVRPFLSKK